MDVPAIQKVISEMETSMNGKGRILVRPSGTEPLLRVMAEAPTHEQVDHVVDTINWCEIKKRQGEYSSCLFSYPKTLPTVVEFFYLFWRLANSVKRKRST